MAKIFGIKTNGLYNYWKPVAELHNNIANLIWTGTIEVPIKIEIGHDNVPSGYGYSVSGFSVKIKTTAGFFNLSDGLVCVVEFFSKSAREAARFAKQMEKKFNVNRSLR